MAEKKSDNNVIKIVLLAVLIIIGILLLIYGHDQSVFEKLSEKTATYSVVINQNGEITYVKTNDDDTTEEVTKEEMIQDIRGILEKYIDSESDEDLDKKIEYLINAETVTKLPYIEPTEVEEETTTEGEETEEEDEQLVGTIKFYRYKNETEANNAYITDAEGNKVVNDAYRLTYITLGEFEAQMESYKNSGNQEVFNHFTMDEDGQVIIACGTKETRTITTGDADLTEEIVREASGEDSYVGNYQNGFSMVTYSISEKPIDYLSLVEQYVMPSNLLYAFLFTTYDIDFVSAIADLAYESEIAIGIYDNDSLTTTNETITYGKTMFINERTTLSFDGLSTTNPAITKNQLYSSPYSYIPNNCYTSSNVKQHILQYLNPANSPTVTSFTDVINISGVNGSGKITSLGESATEFTTQFNKTVTSNSVSTYGVILADTWITRWEAKYAKEENEPTPTPPSSGTYDDTTVVNYDSSDDLLDAFGPLMKVQIESKLKDHAEELKTSAVERIVECSSDLLNDVKITTSDISEDTKKSILENHINSCSTCSNYIDSWWAKKTGSGDTTPTPADPDEPNMISTLLEVDTSDREMQLASISVGKVNLSSSPSISTIYSDVNGGDLQGTVVANHYWSRLQNYVNERNNNTTETFKNELENSITYSQIVTGYKEYQDINFTSTYERTSTKYKKAELTETEKDEIIAKTGEKFSEVFNNAEYHDSRQVFLTYVESFWEYIRVNDDTINLEDTLRYLLNIATGTEDYGEFDEDDIWNLLSAFEPKQAVNTFGMVSPFGCNMEREEFIAAAQSYNGGSSYYKLADVAGDFYDICEDYNVNPGLAFAWACVETGYGESIPYNNLFGMAVYNGENSGSRYSSYADSIEDFCRWVVDNVDSGSTLSRAQEFATVNSKFQGTAENNVYVLFCQYMYLGDIHYADEPDFNNPAGTDYYLNNGSTWGQGGRVYIYEMYELRRNM